MEQTQEIIKFKPSKKHLQIFAKIQERGYYKPAYSDKEPATVTLERLGIVRWREDYRGVIFTTEGKEWLASVSPNKEGAAE